MEVENLYEILTKVDHSKSEENLLLNKVSRNDQRQSNIGVLIGSITGIVIGNPFDMDVIVEPHYHSFNGLPVWVDPYNVIPFDIGNSDDVMKVISSLLPAFLSGLQLEDTLISEIFFAFRIISAESCELFNGLASFDSNFKAPSLAETRIPEIICKSTLMFLDKYKCVGDEIDHYKLYVWMILSYRIIKDLKVLPSGVPEDLPKNVMKSVSICSILGIILEIVRNFKEMNEDTVNTTITKFLQIYCEEFGYNDYSEQIESMLQNDFEVPACEEYFTSTTSMKYPLPCNIASTIDPDLCIENFLNYDSDINFIPMNFPSTLYSKQMGSSIQNVEDCKDLSHVNKCYKNPAANYQEPVSHGIFYNTDKESYILLLQKRRKSSKLSLGSQVVKSEKDVGISVDVAKKLNLHVTYILTCLVTEFNISSVYKDSMKLVKSSLKKWIACEIAAISVSDLLSEQLVKRCHVHNFYVLHLKNRLFLINFGRSVKLNSIPRIRKSLKFGVVATQHAKNIPGLVPYGTDDLSSLQYDESYEDSDETEGTSGPLNLVKFKSDCSVVYGDKDRIGGKGDLQTAVDADSRMDSNDGDTECDDNLQRVVPGGPHVSKNIYAEIMRGHRESRDEGSGKTLESASDPEDKEDL